LWLALHDQRLVEFNRSVNSMILNPALPVAAKKIEAKTILRGVVNIQKRRFKCFPPRRIDIALKYRLLDPYAVVYTRLRHAA
jgi:hypothetical protein